MGRFGAFSDVLINFLTNAASPRRPDGVSATVAEGAVDISASDEGSRIPREEQELIFDHEVAS